MIGLTRLFVGHQGGARQFSNVEACKIQQVDLLFASDINTSSTAA